MYLSAMFSSPVRNYRELLLSLWRRRNTLEFYVKAFYVMGKALSGELSCTGTGFVTKGYNIPYST